MFDQGTPAEDPIPGHLRETSDDQHTGDHKGDSETPNAFPQCGANALNGSRAPVT
jgi:hypothetical protein